MKRMLVIVATTAWCWGCGTAQEEPATPVASATAAPTAAPSTEPSFPVKTMFVAPEVVDCEGEGPRTCLRVRASADDEWELFYDTIEGFAHEPGHAYELRVEVRPVGKPAADASSLEYKLVEIVSKTAP